MAQHFLLTAAARTLSLREVYELTDEDAWWRLKTLRWGDGEETGCPVCGSFRKHAFIPSRKQWRCKDCDHTFSVTSGTLFSSHKLPLKTYLAAIAISANAAKGISALQMSRDLDVQYKTAFVLAHKIRESLLAQCNGKPLEGEVEMDGCYVNGHVRPKNNKVDRVDRRRKENQNPNKRCVFVMRQRVSESTPLGDDGKPLEGAERTLTTVIQSENEDEIKKAAVEHVNQESTVYADENSGYDILHGVFKMKRINHEVQYSAGNGLNTNIAESYFARFRRMQIGQMHHFGNPYLNRYANEIAYREDTRRWSNGRIFLNIAEKCMTTRPSRTFCGYWQRSQIRKYTANSWTPGAVVKLLI